MSFRDKVLKFLNLRKRYRLWQRVVGVLGIVVVFVTTYMLILPAITMTGPTTCGLEEHTHTDDCYSVELVCGLEETTEDQLTSDGALVPDHVHTEDCYEKVLVCGLEEHTHTDECYDKENADTNGGGSSGDITENDENKDNVDDEILDDVVTSDGASTLEAIDLMPIAQLGDLVTVTLYDVSDGSEKPLFDDGRKVALVESSSSTDELIGKICEFLNIVNQNTYKASDKFYGYNDIAVAKLVVYDVDGTQIDETAMDTLAHTAKVKVKVENIALQGNTGERRLYVFPTAKMDGGNIEDIKFTIDEAVRNETKVNHITFSGSGADLTGGDICFISEKLFGGYVSAINLTSVTDGSGMMDATTSYNEAYDENLKFKNAEGSEIGAGEKPITSYKELGAKNTMQKGYDSGFNNGIVRTFDNIVYNLSIVQSLRESGVEYSEDDKIKLNLEMRLYKDISEATFDLDNMTWLNDYTITYAHVETDGDSVVKDPVTKEDNVTKYIMWRDQSTLNHDGVPTFYWFSEEGQNTGDIAYEKEHISSADEVLTSRETLNDSNGVKQDINNSTIDPNPNNDPKGYLNAYRSSAKFGSASGGEKDVINCQILRGSIILRSSTGESVIPGVNTLSASINVLACRDGEVFTPTFNAWFDGNEENLGASTYSSAEGSSAYEAPKAVNCEKIAGSIGEQSNSKLLDNEIVTVTAQPRYDVHIRNNEDLQRKDYYNFNDFTGDGTETGAGTDIAYGRMLGYGVTLQLYNKTDSTATNAVREKGMKGIELPAGDIEFDLSFTERSDNKATSPVNLMMGIDAPIGQTDGTSVTSYVTEDGEVLDYDSYVEDVYDRSMAQENTLFSIVGSSIESVFLGGEEISYVPQYYAESEDNSAAEDFEEAEPPVMSENTEASYRAAISTTAAMSTVLSISMTNGDPFGEIMPTAVGNPTEAYLMFFSSDPTAEPTTPTKIGTIVAETLKENSKTYPTVAGGKFTNVAITENMGDDASNDIVLPGGDTYTTAGTSGKHKSLTFNVAVPSDAAGADLIIYGAGNKPTFTLKPQNEDLEPLTASINTSDFTSCTLSNLAAGETYSFSYDTNWRIYCVALVLGEKTAVVDPDSSTTTTEATTETTSEENTETTTEDKGGDSGDTDFDHSTGGYGEYGRLVIDEANKTYTWYFKETGSYTNLYPPNTITFNEGDVFHGIVINKPDNGGTVTYDSGNMFDIKGGSSAFGASIKIPLPNDAKSGSLLITASATNSDRYLYVNTKDTSSKDSIVCSKNPEAFNFDESHITTESDGKKYIYLYAYNRDFKITQIELKYSTNAREFVNAYLFFGGKDDTSITRGTDKYDGIRFEQNDYKSTTFFTKYGNILELSAVANDAPPQVAFDIKPTKLTNSLGSGYKSERFSNSTFTLNINVPKEGKNAALLVGVNGTSSTRTFTLKKKSAEADGYTLYNKFSAGSVSDTTMPASNQHEFTDLEPGESYTFSADGSWGLYYLALITYNDDDPKLESWKREAPPTANGGYIYFNTTEDDFKKLNTDGSEDYLPTVQKVYYEADKNEYGPQAGVDKLPVFRFANLPAPTTLWAVGNITDIGTYTMYASASTQNSVKDSSGDKNVNQPSTFFKAMITVPKSVDGGSVSGAKLYFGAKSNGNGDRVFYLVDNSTYSKGSAMVQKGTIAGGSSVKTLAEGKQMFEFSGLEPGKSYSIIGNGNAGSNNFSIYYIGLLTYDVPLEAAWESSSDIYVDPVAHEDGYIAPEPEPSKEQGFPEIPKIDSSKEKYTPVLWDYKPNVARTTRGMWNRYVDWDPGNERNNLSKQSAPYNSSYVGKDNGTFTLLDNGQNIKLSPGADEQEIYWGGNWKVTKYIYNTYSGKNERGSADHGELWDTDGSSAVVVDLKDDTTKTQAKEVSTNTAKTATYHVVVSDYTFDFDFEGHDGGHFPTNYAKETYGSTRYTNLGFGDHIRAFSSGYFQVLAPLKANTGSEKYAITATITDFQAKSISGTPNERDPHINEIDSSSASSPAADGMQNTETDIINENDRGIQKNNALKARGSYDIDIMGSSKGGGYQDIGEYLGIDDKWNSDGTATSYLREGEKIDVWGSAMMRVRNDYEVGALNLLTLFDPNLFSIDTEAKNSGQIDYHYSNYDDASGAQSQSEDGLVSRGHMTDQFFGSDSSATCEFLYASYDGDFGSDGDELKNLKEENLKYYTTYEALENAHGTCVGVLMEVRDAEIPLGNYISMRIPVVVNDISKSTYTGLDVKYASCCSFRAWSYSSELGNEQAMHGISWEGYSGDTLVFNNANKNPFFYGAVYKNTTGNADGTSQISTVRDPLYTACLPTSDADSPLDIYVDRGYNSVNINGVNVKFYERDSDGISTKSGSNNVNRFDVFKKPTFSNEDTFELQKTDNTNYAGGMFAIVTGYSSHIYVTDGAGSSTHNVKNVYDYTNNEKPVFTVSDIYTLYGDNSKTSAVEAAALDNYSELVTFINAVAKIDLTEESQLMTFADAGFTTDLDINLTISPSKSISIDDTSIQIVDGSILEDRWNGSVKLDGEPVKLEKDSSPSDNVKFNYTDGSATESYTFTAKIEEVGAKSLHISYKDVPVGIPLPNIKFTTTIDSDVENNTEVEVLAAIRGTLDKREYLAKYENIDDDNIFISNNRSIEYGKSIQIGSDPNRKYVELNETNSADADKLIKYTIYYSNIDGSGDKETVRLYDILPKGNGESTGNRLELVSVDAELFTRDAAGVLQHSDYPIGKLWLTTGKGSSYEFNNVWGDATAGPDSAGYDADNATAPLYQKGDATDVDHSYAFDRDKSSKIDFSSDSDIKDVTGLYAVLGDSGNPALPLGSYLEVHIIVKAVDTDSSARYTNVARILYNDVFQDTTSAVAAVVSRSISGRVFVDKEQAGIYDEGEEFKEGVTVSLFKKVGVDYVQATQLDGTSVGDVVTGPDGTYSFDKLPTGEYVVAFKDTGTTCNPEDWYHNALPGDYSGAETELAKINSDGISVGKLSDENLKTALDGYEYVIAYLGDNNNADTKLNTAEPGAVYTADIPLATGDDIYNLSRSTTNVTNTSIVYNSYMDNEASLDLALSSTPYSLPETGGMGDGWFKIFGGLAVVFAGLMLGRKSLRR